MRFEVSALARRLQQIRQAGWLDEDGNLQTTGEGFRDAVFRIEEQLRERNDLLRQGHRLLSSINRQPLVNFSTAYISGTPTPLMPGQHYPSQNGIPWSTNPSIRRFEELDDVTRLDLIRIALEEREEYPFHVPLASMRQMTDRFAWALRDMGFLAHLQARQIEIRMANMLREQPLQKYFLVKVAVYAGAARDLNRFSFRAMHL